MKRWLPALCAAVSLTNVALFPAPALAAYCGPVHDTQAIETLTMKATLHDRTRIMYLAVSGTYAMSAVEWKGEQFLYFVKSHGHWGALRSAPLSLPPATMQRFDTIIDTNPNPCANPHFVNHPSGP